MVRQHRLALDAGVKLIRRDVEIREVAALDLDLVVLRRVLLVLVLDVVEAGAQPLQLVRGRIAVVPRAFELHARFHPLGLERFRGAAQLVLLLQDDARLDDLELQPALVALQRRGHRAQLFVFAQQALRVLLQFLLHGGDVRTVLPLGGLDHWAHLVAEEVAHFGQQLDGVDRLGDVVGAAVRPAGFDVGRLAARGDHDDGDLARGARGAQQRHASKPPIFGMITSRRMRSGMCSAAFGTPSSPFVAVTISYGPFRRMNFSIMRIVLESSTRRIFLRFISLAPVCALRRFRDGRLGCRRRRSAEELGARNRSPARGRCRAR